MFDELPETMPVRPEKRKRAVLASGLIHVGLVALIIMVPMMMPTHFAGFQLLTTAYMAPPPPPPPAAPAEPAAAEHKAEASAEKPVTHETPVEETNPIQPVDKPALVAPVVVPKDVTRILDAAPGASANGTIGGVPGGVPGGIPGGVLGGQIGGVVGGAGNVPPPPMPKEPVRVGGAIREPRITKMVQPIYPPAAVTRGIEGMVVLEATVTEKGRVEKVKVISGPPALIDAAMMAVQQWQYEPTTLNGTPVAVLLTAKVNFSLKH